MIAVLYRPDGEIAQVVIGSSAVVQSTAAVAGLGWVEWSGSVDTAVTDKLDATHIVTDGVIVERED